MARNPHPEETVRRILDVAEELFCTRGYEHTTMADIVDGLGGLTKGAVYHHFKSKEEIFEAVFERANEPLVARTEEILADRSLSGLEKIRALDEASAASPSAELWGAMRPSSDPIQSARLLAREYLDLFELAHDFIEPAIREGVNWYTCDGEEYAPVTAHDFVDAAKWLLNKLYGEVLKETDWLYDRLSDYQDLKRLTSGYHYILILEKKPKNGKLISMRHSFKAYEVTFVDTYYGQKYTAHAIAFVSRKH